MALSEHAEGRDRRRKDLHQISTHAERDFDSYIVPRGACSHLLLGQVREQQKPATTFSRSLLVFGVLALVTGVLKSTDEAMRV